jgi:type IX secretion system PorP/SprF family membrane protein
MVLNRINAQDNHFSMFYNAPFTLNPAMTGLMVEDIRVVTQYRSQWQSVTVPYNTMMAAFDMNLFKERFRNDFVGVGLSFYNDKAGDSEFRNTQITASGAYSKDLQGENNHYISAGFQVGLGQQALNFGTLLFDSQYDGEILNPDIPSGENFNRQSVTYLDLGAGFGWFYTPSNDKSFYAGVAVSHFNQPNLSFIQDAKNPLLTKFVFHAGFEFPIAQGLSFVPRGIILLQGPHSEFNVGGLLKFRVNPDLGQDYGQNAFYLGTMRRIGDAQVFIAKMDLNRISVSFAYDFNISNLDIASKSNGGFEIGVSYKGWVFGTPENVGPVGCPTF